MIRKFFSPPIFETEEDNSRAKFLNNFIWASITLLTLATILYIVNPGDPYTVPILSALIVVLFIAFFMLKRGRIAASAWTSVILLWIVVGLESFVSDGVRDSLIPAYIVVGLLASIVIGRGIGSLFILLSVPMFFLLAWSETAAIINPVLSKPINYARDTGFVYIAITFLIYFSTTILRDALARAKKSEESLSASNESLHSLNQTLEKRVIARTEELEQANLRFQRRARQFEAIAQVAKAAAANQNLEDLISQLVNVISEKFGFYHAGIFLIDDNREYAELRAANSDGGKQMLARNHKLRIGQTSIVGYVAAAAEARIALDVGKDAVFFNNPDLPDTHSEIALPLISAGLVIGALDIQSLDANAFNEEDVEVLLTLADQVATAVQNARYYESTQELISEAQRTAGTYLRDAWQILKPRERAWNYIAEGDAIKQSNQPVDVALFSALTDSAQSAEPLDSGSNLVIPIRIGGNVVGAVRLNLNADHAWTSDEADIAKAAAERLSLALEAATLLETTQRRAAVERLTSEITGKIGSSTQFDSILRVAAEELSQALGGSEVLIQLQTADENSDSARRERK